MEIFWTVILIAGILTLAYWMRKATQGTPYENENAEYDMSDKHLKYQDKQDGPGKK